MMAQNRVAAGEGGQKLLNLGSVLKLFFFFLTKQISSWTVCRVWLGEGRIQE